VLYVRGVRLVASVTGYALHLTSLNVLPALHKSAVRAKLFLTEVFAVDCGLIPTLFAFDDTVFAEVVQVKE
jgi:hypothetical protein